MNAPLLVVDDLTVRFSTQTGPVTVVEGVGFSVAPGETVGLVGESGCGKSVTSLSIMGLLPVRQARVVRGSIRLEGRELTGLTPKQRRTINGVAIAMIFQEPMTSLNPSFTIGNQIVEGIRNHESVSKRVANARAAELLDLVGIPNAADRLASYPHEFSGGMRQRAMIAMALSCGPQLLIADEPTTALDVTVQAQILELIRRLQRELGMAVIFVTHDLGVVAEICDRVVVMYAGQVVEQAEVEALFDGPCHPYTEGLLRSMPQQAVRGHDLHVIPGSVPRAGEMPDGCRFAPRCGYSAAACLAPTTTRDIGGHITRCTRIDELRLEGARSADRP